MSTSGLLPKRPSVGPPPLASSQPILSTLGSLEAATEMWMGNRHRGKSCAFLYIYRTSIFLIFQANSSSRERERERERHQRIKSFGSQDTNRKKENTDDA